QQVFQLKTGMIGSESNRGLGHRQGTSGKTAGPYNIRWQVPTLPTREMLGGPGLTVSRHMYN
ncbi:MAG: hypothetical protein VW600_16665, partial [Ferrovibrio sp.]